ncbi:hypothetical protein [Microbacterium oxydans]|uniref:Uncharacterized protein n=1 Tax=Microbacterium oxydans TaxID=82380 RepID=A0A0F0L5R3_9MICO|nr:hypothetical protein [Microbacterium oxydans]KJL27665.1 hypothetical protein RS83_02717 [Microbacterium oxydans]
MDAATDEELRRLRARAYGPAADIQQDPEAVRRLQELEARNRRAPAVHTPTTEPSPSVLRAEEDQATETDPERDQTLSDLGLLPSSPAGTGDDSSAPADRSSHRRTGLWVCAIVAASALAAGITAASTWILPVPVSAGAAQVATLEPDPGLEVPPQWFGAAADAAVFEFYGLTLFESDYAPNVGAFDGEERCFAVVNSDQVPPLEEFDSSSWSFEGQIFSDCSVGAFPATVEVPIDADSPDSLRARYPEGTALQFVLNGDRIGVFLDKT